MMEVQIIEPIRVSPRGEFPPTHSGDTTPRKTDNSSVKPISPRGPETPRQRAEGFPFSEYVGPCSDWQQHKWKPTICINCKRPKHEHVIQGGNSDLLLLISVTKNPALEGKSTEVTNDKPLKEIVPRAAPLVKSQPTQIKLSPAELKELRETFNDFDWDKDGTIDKKEFFNYFERHMYSAKAEELNSIWEHMLAVNSHDVSLRGANNNTNHAHLPAPTGLSFGEFRLKWHYWREKLAHYQAHKPENPWVFPLQIKQGISKEFEFGDLIAEGGFGSVVRATSLRNGSQVAVKVLPRIKFVDDDMFMALKKEICILGKLDHPNICKLYEVYEESEYFCLVMELIDGKELFEYVKNRGFFTEPDAKKILYQILEAVDYLHAVGVIHQDIKPENILLIGDRKDNMVVKVIDFGFATKLQPNTYSVNELALGTPEYIAPELCVKGQTYNFAIDMWAVGVITYLMLSGLLPFSSDDDETLQKNICAVDYDFNDPIWHTVSDAARNFITKLLTSDFHGRMTARQALEHPWLKVDVRPPSTIDHEVAAEHAK